MTIPASSRLIVALDVPDAGSARELVNSLGDSVHFYKIGLELATTRGYFELLDWLLGHDKQVFADLKLYDIPATVGAAVRQIAGSGAHFLTVHGERSVVEAAAENKGTNLRILAVTVLTSMNRDDLATTGVTLDVEQLTLTRAALSTTAGADGVIASGLEAAALRARLGPDSLIVTPGIRPAAARRDDDQKRVVTAADSLRAGADYLVVGRPISRAPDPRAAAEQFQREIAATVS